MKRCIVLIATFLLGISYVEAQTMGSVVSQNKSYVYDSIAGQMDTIISIAYSDGSSVLKTIGPVKNVVVTKYSNNTVKTVTESFDGTTRTEIRMPNGYTSVSTSAECMVSGVGSSSVTKSDGSSVTIKKFADGTITKVTRTSFGETKTITQNPDGSVIVLE